MSEWQVSLEFEEGSSSKFWRARVEGGTMYVNYGKIGTTGQTQVKDLGSADAAKKEIDKLEREKRKKGYQDAGGGGGGGGDEDEDDADGDEDEDEAPAPKKKAAAPAASGGKAGPEARLALKGKRNVAMHISLNGASVRMDSVETYGSPEDARKAYYRLLATLAGEGYEE